MDKCRELRSLRWAKTTLEKKASAIPESAPGRVASASLLGPKLISHQLLWASLL